MSNPIRNMGLTIVMFALFFFSIVGQTFTGLQEYNEDQQEHQEPTVGLVEYLGTGHFIEAVFENWESEFLQMASYVILTIFLFQKGSSESKDPEKDKDPVDEDPREAKNKEEAPGPVRRGGLMLMLYENSMSIAFVVLFLLSFLLHAFGGSEQYSREQMAHGGQAVSMFEYIGTSRFWFESFQNWQSEFMSVGVLIVMSVFLRQKGSPESKPVAAPHSKTGID